MCIRDRGSPAPGIINSDNFSARWNRAVNFSAGTYRFRVLVDDGARLYVNDRLIIDQWRQQGPTEFAAEIALSGGAIPVRLEYVDFKMCIRDRINTFQRSASLIQSQCRQALFRAPGSACAALPAFG